MWDSSREKRTRTQHTYIRAAIVLDVVGACFNSRIVMLTIYGATGPLEWYSMRILLYSTYQYILPGTDVEIKMSPKLITITIPLAEHVNHSYVRAVYHWHKIINDTDDVFNADPLLRLVALRIIWSKRAQLTTSYNIIPLPYRQRITTPRNYPNKENKTERTNQLAREFSNAQRGSC